jgi:hypothetical protein
MRRTEHGRLWLVLVGIGCVAGVLHAANLLYLAAAHRCEWIGLACPGPTKPWLFPDSHTYLATADQILAHGLLGASYVSRSAGYPLMLAAGKSWFGEPFIALWLAPLLAGAAAAAIAWIAWSFTGRISAAAAAGLLFCAWPNAYRYSPLLLTDAVHAYVVVTAFAATLAWRRSEGPPMAFAAAGLWAVAQAIRSTFFLLAVLLPLLLWRRNRSSPAAATAAVVWLASCLVPTFTTVLNLASHGTTTESYRMAKCLSYYTVPLLKERMGLGSFAQHRQAANERYNRLPLLERIEAQRRESLEFLAAHPSMAVASVATELHDQLTSSLQPYERDELRGLYPEWLSPPRAFLILFWLSAAVGWLLMVRSQPAVAVFLAATAGMVMIPAAASHFVGGRLRLPIDLLSIPLVAVCWQVAATVARELFGAAGSRR